MREPFGGVVQIAFVGSDYLHVVRRPECLDHSVDRVEALQILLVGGTGRCPTAHGLVLDDALIILGQDITQLGVADSLGATTARTRRS